MRKRGVKKRDIAKVAIKIIQWAFRGILQVFPQKGKNRAIDQSKMENKFKRIAIYCSIFDCSVLFEKLCWEAL